MVYINDERTVEIKNALAIILRLLFDTKQEDRLENIVRQIGKIGELLGKKANKEK